MRSELTSWFLQYRKHFFISGILMILVFSLNAAKQIPAGNVSGTWDLNSSPYLIEGDITVPSGATLIIKPGVVVEFQSWYRLIVNGNLQAVGTSSQQIVFTSTPPGPGEPAWPGIDIMNAPVISRFEYCIVENGQSKAAAPNDRGGAFYILNSNPVIKNCILRNNKVSGYGAAVYCDGASPQIEGCTITGNFAGYSVSSAGGAIYCTNNSQPKITGNSISNNQVSASGGFSPANARGGAIFLDHSNATIQNNIISYNKVHAEGNVPTYARGGAVYIYYSNPLLTGNTIFGNEVTVYSSPGEGGSLFVFSSNPLTVNNISWNNSPQEVFFSSSGTSSVLIAYSDVKGGLPGVITNSHGTVYWQEGNKNVDPMLTDAANNDFSLKTGSPAINAGTAHYTWQGNILVNLDASQYVGAAPDMGALEAGSSGGANQSPVAVAIATPDHGSSPLTVIFSSDGSYDPDGTITSYLWNFGDGATSTNPNPVHTFVGATQYSVRLIVTDNSGAQNTKAIIINVQNGTTLTGGNLSGTWTLAGSPYHVEGDLTIPSGSSLTIEPGVTVEFISWYKITVNGQLLAKGTAADSILFTSVPPGPGAPGWLGIDFINAPDGSSLEYCTIENGKGSAASPNDRGGALYIVNSSPKIKHCTLHNNQVSSYGGAIFCDGASPLIESCSIKGNFAGYSGSTGGGAVYCTNNSQPIITGNIITNNMISASGSFNPANANGGAIFLDHSNATIQNNIISYNKVHAEGNVPTYARGGAIYIYYSNPILTGNTIFGNEVTVYSSPGEGGSLFVYNSYPRAVNNISWNNSPQEVFFSSSGTSSILIAYSDIQGGLPGIVTNSQGTVYWQEGNINNDPLFTDAGNNHFELLSSSPCVNSGTTYYAWQGNILVNLDPSRYNGPAPDMGAIESEFTQLPNQSPVAKASATPLTGFAPLTVKFNSDASSDPDGTITGYKWIGGNFSSTIPNPSYTFTTPGTYIVVLTVTDNDGATGTDQVSIEVKVPASPQLHVSSQTVVRQRLSGKIYSATDLLMILDQGNQPVSGAKVSVKFSGPSAGTASGTTGKNGTVTLKTNYVSNPVGTWCFEVTNISKSGYTYNAGSNVVTRMCENSSSGSTKSLNIQNEELNNTGETNDPEAGLTVYPNPFNYKTSIGIVLKEDLPLNLKIYSYTGEIVRTIMSETNLPAGTYEFSWYGENDSGQLLKSGIYYLRLNTRGNYKVVKLLLIK